MTNKVNNVPELRFQRFEDEWKKKRLKDIVEPLKGNSGENKNLPVLTISAKKGWLNQKERFSQVIAGNSLSKYNELKKGDLSYNKGNSKVALYGIVYKLGFDNALVPNVYKSFRPKPNNVSDFLEKYFHTKILDRQLRRVITSTARMDGLLNISDYDFYNMSLNIPVNNEQKKIGDFFSKLDQQIELEEQKLSLLEEQKKGYMQQIFSQELRFKDENDDDYPEWETRSLNKLCEINPKADNLPNQFLYIDLESVNNGKVEQKKEINIINAPSRAQRLAKKYDIFYQTVRPYQKNNFINLSNRNDIVVSTGYAQLRPLVQFYYLYSLLLTDSFVNKVLVKCTGTNYPAINSTDLSLIQILSSSVFEEQEKIGCFFRKIDQLIEKQSDKIELLKERKKGFLQKMFV